MNLTFNECQTGIRMIWNWVWFLKSIKIFNCNIGIDISTEDPNSQAVASMVLLDSYMENTPTGILTSKSATSKPSGAGSVVLDNLTVKKVPVVVRNLDGRNQLDGDKTGVHSKTVFWAQGRG